MFRVLVIDPTKPGHHLRGGTEASSEYGWWCELARAGFTNTPVVALAVAIPLPTSLCRNHVSKWMLVLLSRLFKSIDGGASLERCSQPTD